MRRATSAFVDDHTSQPLTIFTYVDIDDNQKVFSDGKIASSLFKLIAMKVNKYEEEATIIREDIEVMISKAKNGKKIASILSNNLDLLEAEAIAINVIGNNKLNRHLKELAEILNAYLNASNKNIAKSITQRFKTLSLI
jgi:hypothetical protein